MKIQNKFRFPLYRLTHQSNVVRHLRRQTADKLLHNIPSYVLPWSQSGIIWRVSHNFYWNRCDIFIHIISFTKNDEKYVIIHCYYHFFVNESICMKMSRLDHCRFFTLTTNYMCVKIVMCGPSWCIHLWHILQIN